MKQIKQKIGVLFLATLMLVGLVGCSSNTSVLGGSKEVARIGIAWLDEDMPSEDTQAYIDSIKKAGGEPVLLPKVENIEEAKETLKTVGAVIMTGGQDINPAYYGQEPHELLEEIDDARDLSDYWMIKGAISDDVPLLATCRGMQMLNSVLGGTLYQDIPTQYDTDLTHRDPELIDFGYHEIEVYEGNKLSNLIGAGKHRVNSWHHQGIDKVGEGLKITARATDGIIEGLEYEDASYIVAVQFHPEWHVVEGEDSHLPFFEELITLAKKSK